jgi:putative oxidoreductase
MDTGLLLARLALGLLMTAHGSQKLFGWFGGYGLTGTGGFFESMGFRPGRLFAAAAGAAEFASGLLVALGLFYPFGAALIISVMIVAIMAVHLHNGLLATSNGVELPLLYAAFAAALALIGPGAYSIDAALGISWSPALTLSVLALGALAGFLNLAVRRPGGETATA